MERTFRSPESRHNVFFAGPLVMLPGPFLAQV